ncbi:hypothetical protein [Herbiconiux ginsengi]|uniref:Uncharacterized protein n=1 Tax=Herbiconiux ginsengi TaxID=381665 RepID=A0A1H3S0W3_9MICO|nr:hypothetical protein [Herbiconiux ginsengi]SDZ31562.1 hypothetical protein SAMN05216554_3222 [Herbiconiux ginsengi]
MTNGYWTDDIAALAISTPIDEIRLDRLTTSELDRLSAAIEELHASEGFAENAAFQTRYTELRRLLDRRTPQPVD